MANPPEMQIDVETVYDVTIDTDKGQISLELDPKIAPNTVNNFVSLAQDGFYDGVVFHRVEPGFVVQGGDPTGSGSGGPGYQFADEPVKGKYLEGSVAMANAGADTNGSQFFICLNDLPTLPPNYNLFGHTKSGMDVVKQIAVGDTMRKVVATARSGS